MIYLYAFLILTVLSALRDIITKKILTHSDPDVMAGITGFFIAVFMIPFIMYDGVPESMFSWSFLLAFILGGGLYFAGKYFSFTSYKIGDISYITPLKGLVTVFSIFTAFLLFKEIPSTYGFVGIFCVFIGTYILAFKKNITLLGPIQHLFTDRASQIYLFAVVCYGFTVAIDKWGVEASSPFVRVFCMNFVLIAASFRKVLKEKDNFIKEVSPYMGLFFLGTFFQAVVLVSQAYLIQKIPISYISSFKAASIIVVVVLGGYIFKEKDRKKRIIAASIVLLGIFIIILSEVYL